MATLTHGTNDDCPDVKAGLATRCGGHDFQTMEEYYKERITELEGFVQLLLDSFVDTPGGYFTFPNGETWTCKVGGPT